MLLNIDELTKNSEDHELTGFRYLFIIINMLIVFISEPQEMLKASIWKLFMVEAS